VKKSGIIIKLIKKILKICIDYIEPHPKGIGFRHGKFPMNRDGRIDKGSWRWLIFPKRRISIAQPNQIGQGRMRFAPTSSLCTKTIKLQNLQRRGVSHTPLIDLARFAVCQLKVDGISPEGRSTGRNENKFGARFSGLFRNQPGDLSREMAELRIFSSRNLQSGCHQEGKANGHFRKGSRE
jgi:hypothetical protein